MDGRCGTCKHWKQKVYKSGRLSLMGTCNLITSDNSDLAVVDRDFTKGNDPIWLATKKEFGCVEHEPKDAD